MRNLFVKTALVLCTTIIFLPATVFATEPQNTEVTSAEEGFTDSDPSVSYENDNSLTLDEKEDESTSTEPPSTEPPAEDEKTPDKADTDKENPDPDIFTSGDDFGDGSKSNPFHVVIDSDNPEDGDAPQITDPVIDNGGYSGGGGGGNSTSDSSSEKILHKPQVLLEDSNLSGGRLEAGSTTEMSLTFRNKSCSQNVFGLKISLSTENKGIEFEKNSFYVQVLAPGEAITLEQMITITENCDPGQAVITFSLDYEDSKATATTGTELLSFQIIQPVRVKLEASDIPRDMKDYNNHAISKKQQEKFLEMGENLNIFYSLDEKEKDTPKATDDLTTLSGNSAREPQTSYMPCKAAVVTEGNEIYIPISQAQDLCREIGEPSEISKVYLKINGKNNLENAKKLLSGI